MLSIRIDNGPLLAGKVRVLTTFWQRHWPFERQPLSAGLGLLLTPAGRFHSFGMPCAVDVVFLDHSWAVLDALCRLPPGRWTKAPRATQSVLLLAAGCCDHVGLARGMVLCQDSTLMRAALPCATTLVRPSRTADDAKR